MTDEREYEEPDADTASGGAPEPPDNEPAKPSEVDPDDGTDESGRPVENPSG